MRGIEPSTLRDSLSGYFAGRQCDGLFAASLDHSPTEQLIGEKWHTTALILSAAVEHSALAHDLGKISNPLTCKLSKWTRSNSHYKRRFFAHLMSGLDRHRVMVFAISAMESSIAASEMHFVTELSAKQFYRRHLVDGRPRISIGPVVTARTGEEHTIDLPANQAAMILFIVHFLRRIHQEMHVALSTRAPMYLTWNFLTDKPPNGAGGAFDRAISMLLGLIIPGGALRWGYFLKGDEIETDLLADNVAGLLNEIMRVPQRYPEKFGDAAQGSAGLFYWERWMT